MIPEIIKNDKIDNHLNTRTGNSVPQETVHVYELVNCNDITCFNIYIGINYNRMILIIEHGKISGFC